MNNQAPTSTVDNRLKVRTIQGIAVSAALCLSACGVTLQDSQPEANVIARNGEWLGSGSIVLSRPLPEVSSPSLKTMLGFLPQDELANRGKWIAIDKLHGELSLMDGDKKVHTLKAKGIESLHSGTFQIIHKQRRALWHAPDEYFTKRNLEVPPAGDKERFRKGALGDFVIFIDKDTPIHSGLLWTDEIGGLQMTENDLARLYYQLDVGSVVQIG